MLFSSVFAGLASILPVTFPPASQVSDLPLLWIHVMIVIAVILIAAFTVYILLKRKRRG